MLKLRKQFLPKRSLAGLGAQVATHRLAAPTEQGINSQMLIRGIEPLLSSLGALLTASLLLSTGPLRPRQGLGDKGRPVAQAPDFNESIRL